MTSKEQTNRDSNDEFLNLVVRYQEKSLTPGELIRLNEQLLGSPQRMAEFTRVCETSRLIHEAALLPSSGLSTRTVPESRPVHRWLASNTLRVEHYGLATLLLVCVTLGVLLWQRDSNDQDLGDSVARLEFVSEDAVFGEDHDMSRDVGSLLDKGWIRLEQGVARIVFHSGASVELVGPTTFGIDSPMRSFIEFGQIRVYAPDSARDFVVATASMEIVDLGTRFELSVDRDSQEANVAVIEGLVDMHLGSRGTQRTIQPVVAGFTAKVDASGRIVKLEEQQNGRSPQGLDMQSHILAHWKLDNVGLDAIVTDSSGHRVDGQFRGQVDSSSVPGVADGALELGEGRYVDLSEHVALFGTNESFTIAAWVRDPGERIAIVFSLSDGTESNRVQFHLHRRNVVFGWQNSLHFDAVLGKVDGWQQGRWYHVAVTSRHGMVRLYRDAEQIGASPVGIKLGTHSLSPADVKNPTHASLGQLTDGAPYEKAWPQWFGGQMDDVQFYGRELDARAIHYLYEHPGSEWQHHDVGGGE